MYTYLYILIIYIYQCNDIYAGSVRDKLVHRPGATPAETEKQLYNRQM